LSFSDEHLQKDDYFLKRERVYGSFTRSIELPAEVETDKIKASYKDGILTITLPKDKATKNEMKIEIE
jgi:HSP20 family protein